MRNTPLIEAFKENEQDLIRFLIVRLKSAFAAQDLAQELYLRVCGLDESFAVRNGRAYLFRMASNLAIDHLRREARQAELRDELQTFLGDEAEVATPEEALISRNELERLERAMAELPPLSRRIFYLSRFEQKSQREIAALVGLSPTAVFKHLRRVIDYLAAVRDT